MNEWLNQFFKEIEKEKYNDTVMPKMWNILNEVSEKTGFDEHQILMLSLYGSQNYRMDNENSDIDTECFIFPSHDDIVYAYPLYSKCIQTQYGTCHVKDIRAAFNELRKSSPNMLEILASPYIILNKEYFFIIEQICCHYVNYFADLNKYKLMKGLEGLLNRYKSDLENSKYLANAFRIYGMMTGILCGDNYEELIVPHNYDALTKVKYSNKSNSELIKTFNTYMEIRQQELKIFFETIEPKKNESLLGTIDFWQSELMDKYIKLEY